MLTTFIVLLKLYFSLLDKEFDDLLDHFIVYISGTDAGATSVIISSLRRKNVFIFASCLFLRISSLLDKRIVLILLNPPDRLDIGGPREFDSVVGSPIRCLSCGIDFVFSVVEVVVVVKITPEGWNAV